MNKTELRNVLEDSVNDVFTHYMNSNDIKTGDIAPLQAFDLDNKLDSLADLIYEVCEQNREVKYYTKQEVIKYVRDNSPQFIIDVGAPRDFIYNEGLLEESEKYSIDGHTIRLYLG